MRSDAETFAIRLDTDEQTGECVNAADVVLSYDETIVPVDVSTGRSIFSVWVERPQINTEAQTITFAGGIPNGYCGRIQGDPNLTNVLAEVVVRSPGLRIGSGGDGEGAQLTFTPETTVYRNDGLGTQAELSTYDATIALPPRPGGSVQDPWRELVREDQRPPEEFGITLERDERAFGGKYYIVFSTTDKQTGIDRYEVMEEPLEDGSQFNWGAVDAPWVTAESPYVLGDQTLNSTIRVRAIDKAGNEYVATLIPDEALRTMTRSEIYTYVAFAVGVAVLGLLILSLLWFIRRHRRLNATSARRAKNDGDSTDVAVDDEEADDENEAGDVDDSEFDEEAEVDDADVEEEEEDEEDEDEDDHYEEAEAVDVDEDEDDYEPEPTRRTRRSRRR